MSRVLVTGGAGHVGAAVIRRLLRDPEFEVRTWDRRPVPTWIREGAAVRTGETRDDREARTAVAGCTHVIHIGATPDPQASAESTPYGPSADHIAQTIALIDAAVREGLQRFVYVSCPMVFERASEFPTSEAHLADCPAPRSAAGFSRLAGETLTRSAHREHGLPYTICRPFDPYGAAADTDGDLVGDLVAQSLTAQRPVVPAASGEHTRTPTHVTDIADGIVSAMAAAGANEDFNIAAGREVTVAELAQLIWEACGNDPRDLTLGQGPGGDEPDVARRCPSVEKARELLGWEARIDLADGIRQVVDQARRPAARS